MSPRTPRHNHPPDASMGLLNSVIARPLDAAYEEAAAARARQAAGGAQAGDAARGRAGLRGTWSRLAVLVVAVALGLGCVWGIRTLRQPTPEAAEARRLLEAEVDTRTRSLDAQRATNDALAARLRELQGSPAPGVGQDLGVEAGTVAVSGPGLVVRLDDAPEAKADPENADADLRVQDSDLQSIVNGLWTAGAEAVAVNGYRLTALSAIRSAGEAIQVDLAPVKAPYRIEAIGDPTGLEVGLARTGAAGRITLLRDTYSIPVTLTHSDELRLAGSTPTLRWARAAT